jgi:integrase
VRVRARRGTPPRLLSWRRRGETANEDLQERKQPPLPDGLTPHSLRRTFCLLLYALGEDPGTVMDEMGHTDPALALRVYRQAMRRGEDEKKALRDLVDDGFRRRKGDNADSEAASAPAEAAVDGVKSPRLQAV